MKIINCDRQKYVYLCDINETRLLFAITKGEYKKYRRMFSEYPLYTDLPTMPESYVVQVFVLTEVKPETYALKHPTAIIYEAKRLYNVATKCIDS